MVYPPFQIVPGIGQTGSIHRFCGFFRRVAASFNNSMQRMALRAAADAERYVQIQLTIYRYKQNF